MGKKKSSKTTIQPKRKRSDADRRINQADRFAKIMKILELIQGNGRWNARALAQEFECTEKTIYRFLRVLSLAGIPYFFDDENQCYKVRPDYRFPVLALSDDELLGQAVAAATSQAQGLEAASGATAATRKIAASSSREVADLLADADKLISVFGLQLADHSGHRETIRTIQWALLEKKQVTGRYQSPYEDSPVSLRLHPYRLCLIKNAWYVIGKANQYDNIRTFRVARFQTLRMLDAVAETPDDFDLQEYFGNAWAVFRSNQSYDIKLQFTPEAGPIVTETIWHHTQTAKKQKDGSFIVTFTVDGLYEIVNWLLSWTGRVTVLEPKELRVLYRDRIRCGLLLNPAE